MTQPRYTDLINSLPASVPFVGPEQQEREQGHRFAVRLGANENGFGPSPQALAAMQVAAAEIWKYGDPTSHDLRLALAAHHRVCPENIVVGEGIDGLLGYLTRLFVAPGVAVVTSDGAYPTFNYHVTGFGGVLHKVPYKDDHEDTIALVRRAHETKARLIYLANPDNPMGTWHDPNVIAAMLDDMPADCLLILDEAYIECAPEGTAPTLDCEDKRLIRMRTFSKAYGMAGARAGYALGHPDLIRAFDKIRNHFGMNRVTQIGALVALNDQDWLKHVRKEIECARRHLADIANKNGLISLPSATNFVTIDCGGDGAFARLVLASLIAQGIFVRMPFVSPQDRCIRVSCAPEADIRIFADALPLALKQARTTIE